MSDHDFPEEEILERLRAADPAAGASTDLARLRGAVDRRIAESGAATADDDRAPVVPLAPARSRRSRWLAVAAAAAGAAVVAAGGFAAGRGTAEPAITAAPGSGLESAADRGAATDSGGPESGGPESLARAGADAAIYPAPTVSRMDFQAVGLSEEAGTAPAWTYDPAVSFSAERTAALGGHLGIPGEPVLAGGAWQMGVTDGSGAYLTVSPDGTTTTSYYDPAKDPHQCLRTEPGSGTGQPPAPDAPEGGSDGGAPTYEWCEPTDAPPAPRGEDAFAQVRELLTAAGLDPAGFELVDSDYGDPSVTEVVAHQLVDGRRSGVAWYVAVTAAGVQSFNGSLAPLTGLGDYPVISPAAAVDRLEDPRFGTFGDVHILSPAEGRPLDAAGQAGAGAADSAESAAGDAPVTSGPDGTDGPPPAATPGSPVPWPVEVVAITGADLRPALWTAPSGTALLVPAYELSADDGRTWSVVAVAEEALDLTP
ncbi:hypothetical protein KZX45_11430 [Georgenia sp. EYE_87]|uniref:hypothetical protein n=1 Tax=Georgenia sp. EYE_87 TaxID=2853448 RepID=UPI0020061401|nr:hypothetical protein [Georgenia sp. EYE_87]MCK6211154.1 hypothetical protein [Georgenia sp. EYE_87]